MTDPIVTASPETTGTVSEAVKTEVSFIDSLPEDLRAEKSLHSFKDASSLAKSYLEQSKVFGKRLQDLTPEESVKFYAKMDIPETPEGYGVQAAGPEDTLTPDFIKFAHENKLTKASVEAIKKWQDTKIAEATAQVNQSREAVRLQWQEDLKAEFGGSYTQRVEIANQAIAKFGGEQLVKDLKESGTDSHPSLVKAFYEVGKLLQEDKGLVGKLDKSFGLDPEQVQKEIEKLYSEHGDALINRSHPKHAYAKARNAELYKLAEGA